MNSVTLEGSSVAYAALAGHFAKLGRVLFGIAILAFGVQNFVWARFVGEATVPIIPWVPGQPWLAVVTGIALVASGISIVANVRAQLAAVSTGMLFLLCDLLLQIPKVAASPLDVGVRTTAFETLAMCGSAWILAGALPTAGDYSIRWKGWVSLLAKLGLILFAISSVVFGIDHFLVLGVIVSLVPNWIPGSGLFWAYLTDLGFIAAGVSMLANRILRFAGAAMLGVMFMLWFLVLHGPRVVSYPRSHDPHEWSSAFIALAMCGGSWICAGTVTDLRSRRALPIPEDLVSTKQVSA
jgi:uncharacterized membrane protein